MFFPRNVTYELIESELMIVYCALEDLRSRPYFFIAIAHLVVKLVKICVVFSLNLGCNLNLFVYIEH